jgi:nucleoside-diphosphate-sugar epimerase
MNSQSRIFLTGATGVIGRRVIPLLVGVGHRVTAVGRTPEKCAQLASQGAEPVQVDIFAPDAVRRAVAGHDVVINLATHIPSSTFRLLLPGAWRENDRLRRDASARLAEAAISEGAGRFIQESFAPIYADGGEAWIDERWPVQPVRYNRTVINAEQSAAHFTEKGGTGIVLRFAAFYGSDAFQTLDMIRLIRRGWAPLPGSPEAFYSSVSHDDAATAVVAALNLPAGIYNVTDDEPVRRRECVDSLAECLGVPPPKFPPRWLAYLAGSLGELMSRSLRISNRKFRADSGWAPKYPSVPEGWRAAVKELAA